MGDSKWIDKHQSTSSPSHEEDEEEAKEELKAHGITGTSIFYATLAALLFGGPLVGMMGLSFMASLTLLLLAFPLLVLFSPLLALAALVLALAMAGFGGAAAMALTGLSYLSWVSEQICNVITNTRSAQYGTGDDHDEVSTADDQDSTDDEKVVVKNETLTESGQKVKELATGNAQRGVQVNSPSSPPPQNHQIIAK